MIRVGLIALPLLAGCSLKKLSENEARHVFEGLNVVTSQIVLQTATSLVDGGGGGGGDGQLEVNTNNGEIHGQFKPLVWEGDLGVSGEVTSDSDTLSYDLSLEFNELELDDGPTFDGEIVFTFWADDSFDVDNLAWSAGVGIDGHLEVTGRDTGRADLQYDVELAVEIPKVTFRGDGDISGHDVSDWDQIVSGLF